MSKEWVQRCKDCGEVEFGYSDAAYRSDRARGLSRIERCPIHRKQHAGEIKDIASSHFGLRPRSGGRSILGDLYLGELSRGPRTLQDHDVVADPSEMDLGVTEDNIRSLYQALEEVQVVVLVGPTGSGKSTYVPYRLIEPLPPLARDHFTRCGPIIVTQPTIGTSDSIPKVVAKKLLGSSVGPGFEVGYRHGDETGQGRGEHWDRRNRLVYVTDGTLLNWISDGEAGSFSIIMIDEAHKRSCNIDLIMALLKRELLTHPHLRLIIASATIDTESFLTFYGKNTSTRLVQLTGEKSKGYERHWWMGQEIPEEGMSDAVAREVIRLLERTKEGGILAFLPGAGEIHQAVEKVTGFLGPRQDIAVFPLYAALGIDEGRRARSPIPPVHIGDRWVTPRRVVIATDAIETGITIPDIVYVVDSGLIKQTVWTPATCRKELKTRSHSQDGCKQRWGRAGRVQHGDVFTLYSEKKFETFNPHTPPEIVSECLDGVLLSAKAAGVQDLENLSWVTNPMPEEMNRSLGAIRSRAILDSEDDLTEDGIEMHRIAQSVSGFLDKCDYNSTNRGLDVAALLVLADRHACLVEAATVLAMMPRMGTALYWRNDGLLRWESDWDLASKDHVSRVHQGLRVGCLDDLDFACKLFALYEGYLTATDGGLEDARLTEWPDRCFINIESFGEVDDARRRILHAFTKGKHGDESLRPVDFELVARLRTLLPVAWPDRMIKVECGNPPGFTGIDGAKFTGVVSSRCAGIFAEGTRLVAAILDRLTPSGTGGGQDLAVANFVTKVPSKIPSRNPAELAMCIADIRKKWKASRQQMIFIDQIAPVSSRIATNDDGDCVSSLVEIGPRFVPRRDASKQEENERDDSQQLYGDESKRGATRKAAFLRSRSPSPPLDAVNPATVVVTSALSGEVVWHGRSATRGAVVSWSETGGKLTVAMQTKRRQFDLSEATAGSSLEATIERAIDDPYSGRIAGVAARLGGGTTLLVEADQFSVSGYAPAIPGLVGHKVRLTIDDWGSERVVSLLPAILDDLEAVLEQDGIEAEVTTIGKRGPSEGGAWVHFAVHRPNGIVHSIPIPLTAIREEWRKDIKPGAPVYLQVKRREPQDGLYRAAIPKDFPMPDAQVRALMAVGVTLQEGYAGCAAPLSYDSFVRATKVAPDLLPVLRRLLAYSNEMRARVVETPSAEAEFKALLKEATAVKNLAKTTDPSVTRMEVQRLQARLKEVRPSHRYWSRIDEELQEAWLLKDQVGSKDGERLLKEARNIAAEAKSMDGETTRRRVKALQADAKVIQLPPRYRDEIRAALDLAWKTQELRHLRSEIAKLEGWIAQAHSTAKVEEYKGYLDDTRRKLRKLEEQS